ncbi:nuclease-related domain-containing protein [Alteribacter lacisalsi]|nr:nuclease-related domain-containing protein [Alteribacter lacisalsi]
MIIRKPRTTPLEILAYEALIRRMPELNPKKEEILAALRSRRSGHKGEMYTEHYINTADVPPFYVYHSLRFAHVPGEFAQIDTLLLSRQLAVILEIKYLGGESLYFKGDSNQLIQTSDEGKKKVYDCPVVQARRQKLRLIKWSREFGFPSIRVEHFAVMANSYPELIFSEDYKERWRVFRNSVLKFRLQELTDAENRSSVEKPFSPETLDGLDRALLDAHEEALPDLLKRHQVRYEDLIKGVFCPVCPKVILKRTDRGWSCPGCEGRFSTVEPVRRALKEYCLIAGSTITNAQLTNFLNLQSTILTTNILRKLDLPKWGSGRGSVYSLDRL